MDITGIIIKRRKQIILAVLLFTVISGILFFRLPINYAMTDYLPEQSNSTLALDVLAREFKQDIPNVNVMMPEVSIQEALVLKDMLEALSDVREVLWLDDYAIDLRSPLETQDQGIIANYYKDEAALYLVTVEAGRERPAVQAIRELIGDKGRISGSAAEMAESQALARNESLRAILLLAPMILLVLAISSTSWAEPILYLLAIGAAVILNLGTDYFRGEISFVTMAVSPILQLAVSIDYAVFLSHSFNDALLQGLSVEDAMRKAIRASGKSISASMLTTLFGFVALLFMQFRIGSDMAVSLVKGVLFSFASVMIFLPALILTYYGWIHKTRHKLILPRFRSIGNTVVKIRYPVMGLLLAIVIPCFLAQANNRYFYGTGGLMSDDSDGYLIEEAFGKTNQMVLLVPRGSEPNEILLCRELEQMPYISGVLSYVTAVDPAIPVDFLDESITNQFYAPNYARIILNIETDYEGPLAFQTVQNIRAAADRYYPGMALTCGQSANLYDIKTCVEQDNRVVNAATVIFIYLILALTFRSWLIPIPLILVIKCSMWINYSVAYFQDAALCYIGYIVVSTVQMGATVDYAIIETDHYMENRKTMDKIEAAKHAVGGVFGSIIISAFIMAICGFALGQLSSNVIVSALGNMIGRGAVLSLSLVVLLLPTWLILIDPLIPMSRLRLKMPKWKKGKESSVR